MKSDAMDRFATEEEFNQYMSMLSPEMSKKIDNSKSKKSVESAKESDSSGPANEIITNNQETGVDEGGIVKNIGNSLVTLRKGRLYAISLEGDSMTESHTIDVAREPSLNQSVWYDELLVSSDRLYVIGYRYHTGKINSTVQTESTSAGRCPIFYYGATEINSFRLKDGKFERLTTSFIKSYDYFSGHNYTSRMVDGNLIFYMPHSAFTACSGRFEVKFPQYLQFDSQQGFSPTKPLFGGTDVFKNIESINTTNAQPIFHSLVKCQLPQDGSLDCQAKALLGPFSREKYVSQQAIYLATENKVYNLDLKDLSVRAHSFSGRPLDQFSFKEQGESLHILVQESPTVNTNEPSKCLQALYSLPIRNFDKSGNQLLENLRTQVAESSYCSLIKNKFVGEHLIYAVGTANYQNDLYTFHLTSRNHRKLPIAGRITRIESTSEHLAFLSTLAYPDQRSSTINLVIGLLKLDEPDLRWESQNFGATTEGESRSHGFFQKRETEGSHILGLPIIGNPNNTGSWWGRGLSNIAFMRVGQDLKVSLLGVAESGRDTQVCQSSCVDWYGNTRTIFLGNRIFALMGQEIEEFEVGGGSLKSKGPRLRLSVIP